jgi:hypothetical protein
MAIGDGNGNGNGDSDRDGDGDSDNDGDRDGDGNGDGTAIAMATATAMATMMRGGLPLHVPVMCNAVAEATPPSTPMDTKESAFTSAASWG